MAKNKKIHPTTQYALDITGGKILANKWTRLACNRHLVDLEKGKDRGLYFDEVAANHIIMFFEEFLIFYEGDFDGKPFLLTPYQKFVLGSIFGWKKKPGGFRRFRTVFCESAKGMGKTPLCSGVGLYGLCFDDEPGSEIYSCATTREQAGILFRDARTFAEKSPSLREFLKIDKHNIAYEMEHGFFRPVSSEHRGLDGKRPHIALIDEIHEHPNDLVVRKMSAGTKGRRQPLIFEITNALSITTPMLTVNRGWIIMEDIIKGDIVFDETGSPCTVQDTTDVMYNHKCYEVLFDNGERIIADAGHLWKTTQRYSNIDRVTWNANGQKIFAHEQIRTTEQIRSSVEAVYPKKTGHFYNHSIPVTAPIKFRKTRDFLLIAPYYLGLWLGDGTSKDTSICCHKDDVNEILSQLCNLGEEYHVGKRRSVKSSGNNVHLHGVGVRTEGKNGILHTKLRILSLLNNKHIPRVYLESSHENRLSLLQGLMDSDGHISKQGRCVFTQTAKRSELFFQVVDLINGLGIKCFVDRSRTWLHGNSFDILRCFFTPPHDLPIFRLQRKSIRQKYATKSNRIQSNKRHFIIGVHEVPSVPVKCINVDSASHLFLAGKNLIPTHNSGVDRNSICYQHHEYTEKILDGIVQNDEWFGIISGLDVCPKCESEGKSIPQDGCPDCDNWRDESVWIKSNPNLEYLGKPFKDYLRSQVKQAMAMPAQENIVKRLNFNIWTNSITKWLSAESWAACADSNLRIEDFAGYPCYMAFDLANKIDISALILTFRKDDELIVFGKYYLPEETILRSRITHYKKWVKEGYIIQTPGAMTDYRYIEDDIKKINEINPILELAYDPHEATYLVNNLIEWLGQDKCIQINQGPALMSEPMKQLEGLVYDVKIHHNGDPVLSWMISNVVKKEGRNSGPVKFYYPTKSHEDNKIDGPVALIMNISRAMLNKGPMISAYENEEAEILTF